MWLFVLYELFFISAKALIEKNNINVVMGPYDDAISIVTEKVNIPYICTTPAKKVHVNNFHVMPPLSDFSQAMYDITNFYKFDKISLFYDDDQGTWLF